MDIFQKLPMEKRSAMELLFQNCTEKVKNYMFTMDVAAGQTFIQAGELCRNAAVPGQRGRADRLPGSGTTGILLHGMEESG